MKVESLKILINPGHGQSETQVNPQTSENSSFEWIVVHPRTRASYALSRGVRKSISPTAFPKCWV